MSGGSRALARVLAGACSAAAMFAQSPAFGQTCPADFPAGATAESERYRLAYRSRPEPIPLGAHFALELALCAKQSAPPPETVTVSAIMPAHGHGMNYQALVTPQSPGRYRAEGLLLHMPGRWDLLFEVRGGGKTDRLTHSISVE